MTVAMDREHLTGAALGAALGRALDGQFADRRAAARAKRHAW